MYETDTAVAYETDGAGAHETNGAGAYETDGAVVYETDVQCCMCHTVFTFRICESSPSNSRRSRVGPLYVALLLAARPSQ